MKRIILIGVVITFTVVCCVVAGYFSSYYYYLYKGIQTNLEQRYDWFGHRIALLEARKQLFVTQASGHISTITTTNLIASGVPLFSASVSGDAFTIEQGKMNLIVPEFRIPAGSTKRLEFDIRLGDGHSKVVGAWLSHAGPYEGLASFKEFLVYCPRDTNVIRFVVQPKPDVSIDMGFTLVVLHEY